MRKKAVIIGGGVTGCTAARELSQNGYEVTLIEKEKYLGGGCHTFFWGGHPYTNGPRPLHVINDKIFNYINEIVPLRIFHLFLDTYIERDKSFYSFPIHWDDIQRMPDKDKILKELEDRPKENNATNFEEGWINSVGTTLYDKYIKKYTEKMWDVKSNTIFKEYSWSVKGSAIQKGNRVVSLAEGKPDHAYPIESTGYNRFFDYCVKDAKVILGTEITNVDMEKKIVYIGDEKIQADIIISTIAIDDLMNKRYGELRYSGRDFLPFVLPIKNAFIDNHHFIHYPNEEEYTRIVEYKNLTLHESEDTLLVMEKPSGSNKLYPYKIQSEIDKSKKYMNDLPKDVYSIGRLGSYQYLCIGNCFEQVWELMEQL